MNGPLIISNTLQIEASRAKIWQALVNPEETKKYMFGCEAISDWEIGSPLLWQGNHEGKERVFVKGTVLDIEVENYLAYTTIDPNDHSVEDVPENYLTVTYTITTEHDKNVLTITQGDYSKVGNGENRFKESFDGGGWEPILMAIKRLAEAEN